MNPIKTLVSLFPVFLGLWISTGEAQNLFSEKISRLDPLNSHLPHTGPYQGSAVPVNRSPLYFVRNEGQFPDHVRYYCVNGSTIIYFTTDGIYFSVLEPSKNPSLTKPPWWSEWKTTKFENRKLNRSIVKLILLGASKQCRLTAEDLQKTRFHYFLGHNPEKWRTNVAVYATVFYKNIYPGIDLKFYGNVSGELEYDFVVRSGSNPSQIRFEYVGAHDVKRTAVGEISIDLNGTIFLQRRPHVFQRIGSEKIEVQGTYNIVATTGGKGVVYGFDLRRYDIKRTLFIDPIISFSTYLGGSEGEECLALDKDSSGNLYITGISNSLDFPVTPGAFQTTSQDYSAFVTKMSPDGSSILYSTYLGGSGGDSCSSIKVDETGAAYVGCATTSLDFPTVNPFQANLNGYLDAAVAKLNSDGSALLYSSYLGGTGNGGENIEEIALHNHQVYSAGVTTSIDFPVKNPFQGTYNGGLYDGFVAVFTAAGDDLVFSTYLGGSDWDNIFGIDIDNSGAAYVVGRTLSVDFPVTQGAYDTKCADGSIYCEDAIVSKFSPDGSKLVYSTFLGGKKADGAIAVAIDSSGVAYITGYTSSSDFPIVNPVQLGLGLDAFVTKLTADGTALLYSTYLGGRGDDRGFGIKVDVSGAAYVTGFTEAPNFPRVMAPPIKCPINPYESSAFVTKVSAQGNSWEYSTCLGGSSEDSSSAILIDDSGAVYVAGYTLSDDFPVWNAIQPNKAGFMDGFITKILCDSITPPSVFEDSGPAVFSVHLCSPRSSDIAISYFTSDGNAIAGSDYVSTSGVLTILAGETDGAIEVPLLGDAELEPEENFFLHLSTADIDLGEGIEEAKLLDSDALLYDNFEDDVVDWDVIKGEIWEQGGSLIAFGNRAAAAFAPVPWVPSGASGCSVCTIESQIAVASDGSDYPAKAVLEAWYQNSANDVEVIIDEEKDKWVLKQRSGGQVVSKSKAMAVIDPYAQYDVSLSFNGTNFVLSVNGVTIINIKAATPPSGKVGFKVKRSVATLNYIRVF